AGGDDGVEGGGGLLVVLEGEQTQGAEFMQRGVRGKLLDGLVHHRQGLLVGARPERFAGPIKELDRRLGGIGRLGVVHRGRGGRRRRSRGRGRGGAAVGSS